MFTHINIGVRHILPVYIGFSLLAAAAAIDWLELGRARKWILIAVAVLVVWLAGSSLLSHPDYLAYFNEFAFGEPQNILVDSDLDWGQDVKRLATRLREVGAQRLTWVPLQVTDFEKEFGFPPIDMRMDVLHPAPGWNAVSMTVLKAEAPRAVGLLSRDSPCGQTASLLRRRWANPSGCGTSPTAAIVHCHAKESQDCDTGGKDTCATASGPTVLAAVGLLGGFPFAAGSLLLAIPAAIGRSLKPHL